jgi:hypothetical protein
MVMKIDELLKIFTIEPKKDIEPNFKLTKTLEIDAGKQKGCFNCGDTSNQRRLKSESWTGVQYCWKCNHLNVIYYQERMAGIYVDVIECYTEK